MKKSEVRYYAKRINSLDHKYDKVFMHCVALTQAPDGVWGVTEWLEGDKAPARTYWHNELKDAEWAVKWWHDSNINHGYTPVGTLFQ